MVFRGQMLGKYRIVEPLGSGGFGTVYLAEDTWIDKRVALKIPHRQNLDFGELLREPRLLASLNHPNIGAIYGVHESDGAAGAEPALRALSSSNWSKERRSPNASRD